MLRLGAIEEAPRTISKDDCAWRLPAQDPAPTRVENEVDGLVEVKPQLDDGVGGRQLVPALVKRATQQIQGIEPQLPRFRSAKKRQRNGLQDARFPDGVLAEQHQA